MSERDPAFSITPENTGANQNTEKFERPEWNTLTQEQQDAIFNGPHWIYEPAEMVDFEDVSSFRCHEDGDNGQKGSDNFKSFFNRQGINSYVAEQSPAFQRFNILYPETVKRLDKQMIACDRRPTADELWRELLKAYKMMRVLVDKSDRCAAKDGVVDSLILTR